MMDYKKELDELNRKIIEIDTQLVQLNQQVKYLSDEKMMLIGESRLLNRLDISDQSVKDVSKDSQ